MRLNEVVYTNAAPVDGYGAGFFRIGGKKRDGAQAILPGGVTDWGGYEDSETLLAAKDQIDVLLVGTGPEIAHIPAGLRKTLEDAGIGAEVMATPQACRTYNVLLGEGRRVGLAVLPV